MKNYISFILLYVLNESSTSLTSVVRCRADNEGNFSLHTLHLTSLSALLVSSVFGVSALLGRWRPFSLRGLWTRLQELSGKLAAMLEEASCLSEPHRFSHVSIA